MKPSPFDAAIMSEDPEDRIGSAEIVMDRVGTVDLERTPLAEHQQPRGVIDLAVREHNAEKRRISDRARGLCFRKRLQLGEYVRRRIKEDPAPAVCADGNGRLR